MTQQEIARFALMLRESDRIRAMIADDEAREGPDENLARERVPDAAQRDARGIGRPPRRPCRGRAENRRPVPLGGDLL